MSVDLNMKMDEASHNSDTESIGSYEDLRDSRSPSPGLVLPGMAHRKPRAPKLVFKVDGKVPPVLHVVDYYGIGNRFLSCRHSASPFKEIPDLHRHAREDGDEDSEQASEKPILEIVTNVYTSPHYPGTPPLRRAGSIVQERPITMGFGNLDYRTENVFHDDEQVQQAAGPSIGRPSMIIHSEYLINALKAVVSYYPYFNLSGKSVHVNAPYRVLYHHRKELEEYRHNQPATHTAEYAATTVEHIDTLLRFLEENLGTELAEEQNRHCTFPNPMATFEYFWLVLKPGSIIYAKRYDIWTPYVISNVSTGNQNVQDMDSYRVDAWMLESNGVKIDRFMESFTISPWMGEQAITSLSVIPEEFWKEDFEGQGGFTMREKQIKEGKLYWELLKRPTYMEYDGLLVNPSSGNRDAEGPTGFMCGRVVCDAEGFDKYYDQAPEWSDGRRSPRYRGQPSHFQPNKDHIPASPPQCGCKACARGIWAWRENGPFAGFEDLDPANDAPPENPLFYHVLCKTIPGFILGNRKWGHLHLANLKPVKTDREAFKYLVLDDEVKLTVKALIGKFATGVDGKISPWGNDFVKNKGEGRIFLLHGSPGVGKTCTAECVAELTNRPLISLTSGDLSVDSWRVERNLSYFLELGQRYGALVLLDEADVYLERRRAKDIDRNGLVSVFLRALEYYRGVLFLTTNRVQSFDGAFLSRIHVALHYKNLRDDDRERIWTNNFDRLDRDSAGRVHVAVAAREYVWQSREVRDLRWNGREIRNAMQTALALAESDAEEEGLDSIIIAEKHLRAVVKMSKGFKDYIKLTTMRYEDDSYLDECSDEEVSDDEGIVRDD